MSIKILKKFTCKKSESAASVAARLREYNKARAEALARLRERNKARAEALTKAKQAAAKKNEDEGGEGDQVDDINMDAETAEVLFSTKDANYDGPMQVLVGEDPVDGGIVVAVATAEKDNVEEEEVLASITVGEGDAPAAGNGEEETEESKKAAAAAAKAKAVEEARTAIKARLKK